MDPIFIIGTERSGTNLIRLMLDAHSSIGIPHPPHILKNFFKLEPLYGDLNKDPNLRKLVNDVVTMGELHPYPWEVKIDREAVFNAIGERNLINVFFAVYGQYLKATGKKRWGCKSTFMIYHVSLIRRYYPQAKFIYMVRDGRDVAVSAKDSIFNHYSVYYTASLWKKEQQIGIYWLNKLSKEEIFLVRYEDLVDNPEALLRQICAFLQEPFQGNMLDFFKSEEPKKSSSLSRSWENTSRPVMKGNSGKYKLNLTEREIGLFEGIAGQELDYFSYPLARPFYVSEGMRARGIKFKLAYLFEEKLLMLKAQLRHFAADKNSLLRYKKFWFLKSLGVIRRIK